MGVEDRADPLALVGGDELVGRLVRPGDDRAAVDAGRVGAAQPRTPDGRV